MFQVQLANAFSSFFDYALAMHWHVHNPRPAPCAPRQYSLPVLLSAPCPQTKTLSLLPPLLSPSPLHRNDRLGVNAHVFAGIDQVIIPRIAEGPRFTDQDATLSDAVW